MECLRLAHSHALNEQPAELLALDLRLALDHIGQLVGTVYTNDLLDRIFSRFCIGRSAIFLVELHRRKEIPVTERCGQCRFVELKSQPARRSSQPVLESNELT